MLKRLGPPLIPLTALVLMTSCSSLNMRLPSLKEIPSDFCTNYSKAIHEPGDAKAVSSISKLSVKKRITSNEIYYQCECEKVQAPFCIKE